MKIAAGLALGLCVSAAAQDINSGNEFLRLAKRDKSAAIQYVRGYFHGWQSALVSVDMEEQKFGAGSPKTSEKVKLCVPSEVTNEQATDVVIAFIDSKPAYRHMMTASLAQFAFMEAWPCPKR